MLEGLKNLLKKLINFRSDVSGAALTPNSSQESTELKVSKELTVSTESLTVTALKDTAQAIPVEESVTPQDLLSQTYYVQCASPSGSHRMAYHEWGDPDNQNVLICVHGLTRRGSDFNVLAKAMSDRYRVICPDVVGRGDSDWLDNPMLYGLPQYVADMSALVNKLGVQKVDWFGTSMGGLIGIFMASQEDSPIRRMIINDVGPRIEPESLKRLGDYVGKPLHFATKEEGLIYLNSICAPFGNFTSEQWRDYNGPHLVQDGSGWKVHYDPDISKPFAAMNKVMAAMGEMMTWKAFDSIQADMLVVRGANSDLLSAKTVTEMCRRRPRTRSIEIPGVGHAPAFITPEQVAIAREFFS